jgi:hypothetical protein
MLLQTNSYIVPKEKRTEHARLLQRFRHTLARLGCDQFECYEQTGQNWSTGETTGRFVQIMRFRDRKHQVAVQQAERTDPTAQSLIKEFSELINFPYQQQQGLFAVGFYNSVLPAVPLRIASSEEAGDTVTQAASEQTADTFADEPVKQADPLNPAIDSGVAMADFGEPMDLHDDLINAEHPEDHQEAKSRSTADDAAGH